MSWVFPLVVVGADLELEVSQMVGGHLDLNVDRLACVRRLLTTKLQIVVSCTIAEITTLSKRKEYLTILHWTTRDAKLTLFTWFVAPDNDSVSVLPSRLVWPRHCQVQRVPAEAASALVHAVVLTLENEIQ